jgi:DNA repair protein RadD
MTVVLRPHQIEAADAVEDAWREGVEWPIVDGCVSFGKSLLTMELARREVARGGRSIICTHVRELVEQNAKAGRALMPGTHIGINAAALKERTWRAPVISAAIQSIYRHAQSFGPVTQLGIDEAHLVAPGENGMYRELVRAMPNVRGFGVSGTVFRLQGGSLVEGEGALFTKIVYRYTIMDGIRDGYLVPPVAIPVDDKLDPSKLRIRQGDYTGDSQDAQMVAAMDNHIAQLIHYGSKLNLRKWLVFEASDKAVRLMTQRLNDWGIPADFILASKCAADDARRVRVIENYRNGRLRVLVGMNAVTTGLSVEEIDLLVMRRRTKSLGLFLQMIGRGLRTIGGNILASIAAGKEFCYVADFAGNCDELGPIDFLRIKDTKSRLISCEECGRRNAAAAAHCWSCDAVMTKNCPACLQPVAKGTLDCPHAGCGFDMRKETSAPTAAKLFDVPSGAALIATYKTGAERAGGWLAVVRVWDVPDGAIVQTGIGADQARHELRGPLAGAAKAARWLRVASEGVVVAVLVPNGGSRSHAKQISADGSEIIVPLPAVLAPSEAAA